MHVEVGSQMKVAGTLNMVKNDLFKIRRWSLKVPRIKGELT